jgi:restriction endonuclease S subunit
MVEKLGDICAVDWGNTALTKKSYVDGGEYLAVSATGGDGRLNHYEHEASVCVLSAIGAQCGKMFFPQQRFTAIKNTITLTPKADKVVSKFLYYLFTAIELPKRGAAQPFISKGDIQNFKVPFLPPLAEQQRIVAKLDAAFAEIDTAIEVAEAKEAEVEKLKASLLSDLFSGDAVMWNRLVLQDACSLISRGISPKYLESGGVRVLNQKCIRSHTIDYSLARRHDISIKGVKPERFIQKGDVLVNSTGQGTLGRVAQVRNNPDEPTTVDSHVTIVRPKPEFFCLDYFGFAAIFIENELKAAGQGTSGQTELSKTKLKEEFSVSFPLDFAEQQRIVAKLDAAFAELDTAKLAIQRAKENHAALKTAILAQELTPPAESEAA